MFRDHTFREHRPATITTAALLTVMGLVLTSCSSDPTPAEPISPDTEEPSDDSTDTSGTTDDVDTAALGPFYEQSVQWEPCETERFCATVEVPLSYEDPQGERFTIELITQSTDQGDHLLTNPGGPGSSGYDLVNADLEAVTTEQLRDAFNIVGFDPRGVDRSEGIQCMSDAEFDEFRQLTDEPADADDSPTDEQTPAEFTPEQIATQCEELSGPILSEVDTFSAARDMDIIRHALGEDQLNYLGFSYGTKLGLAYAELFEEHTGRFVLDAVMDVSIGLDEIALGQAQGIDEAFSDFATWCAAQSNCAVLGDSENVTETIAGLLETTANNPPEAPDGRTITATELLNGMIAPLYFAQGWPILNELLQQALLTGDLSGFLQLADLQESRLPDGSYEWQSSWAFQAIMCSDYRLAPVEPGELSEVAPLVGPYLVSQGDLCAELPEPSGSAWTPSESLDDVLFIGQTGDPATPVQWSENMHQMLPNSSLLIHESAGHIAYRPGNQCVANIVDDFLIDGVLFEGQQTCS